MLNPIKLKRWEVELKDELSQARSRSKEAAVLARQSESPTQSSVRSDRRSWSEIVLGEKSPSTFANTTSETTSPFSLGPSEDEVLSTRVSRANTRDSTPASDLANSPAQQNDLNNKTLWDAANITKSPTLTRLFDAIKIDEEYPLLPPPVVRTTTYAPERFITADEIQDLMRPGEDQNNHHGSILKHWDRDRSDLPLAKRRKGEEPYSFHFTENYDYPVPNFWNLSQVSPFPTHTTKSRLYIVPKSSTDDKPLSQQLLDCEIRFRKLERSLPVDNPGLIFELQRMANLAFRSGEFKKAERLYLRLARAKQKRIGREHPDTVIVYLDLIENKIDGGELEEAERLHQGIHSRIIQLFGIESELSIRSLLLMANIRYYLPRGQTAASIQREALQVALNAFGLRHAIIPHILAELASYTFGWVAALKS
jgi:hypothetical protein